MPVVVPSRPFTAVAPSATMTLGLSTAICALEIRQARRHLVGQRGPVVRRAALQDVADEDLVARVAHGLDHLRQKLTGPADKRQALPVLVGARRFADEHDFRMRAPCPGTVCVRVSCSEHCVHAATALGDRRRARLSARGGALDLSSAPRGSGLPSAARPPDGTCLPSVSRETATRHRRPSPPGTPRRKSRSSRISCIDDRSLPPRRHPGLLCAPCGPRSP